jgi:hypothetical protein
MESIMQQRDILEHYRHLREISTRHHSAALARLAEPTLLEQAKHLGLAYGRTLGADSEEEMTLIFDLAIHTAKPGRSRAIGRYAKATALSPGSDEANALDAIRHAQFSLWRIESHHETAGLVVKDVLRDNETWLVDETLTDSAEPGLTFAARLCWPAAFAMTCGVVVPVDAELVEDILIDNMALQHHTELKRLADDPRFAAAIYRSALDAGIMEHVAFREPAPAVA